MFYTVVQVYLYFSGPWATSAVYHLVIGDTRRSSRAKQQKIPSKRRDFLIRLEFLGDFFVDSPAAGRTGFDAFGADTQKL